MITGRLFVDEAGVRTSSKTGNKYGFAVLMGMGVSALDVFATEDDANKLEVGKEYDFKFKMKGKEISGIKAFKLVNKSK